MVFGRKKAPAPSAAVPPPQQVVPTARDLSRQNDRTIQRAQRDMQRERIRLEQDEKKITAEIKSLSRQGRVAEARMLAKNLVQVRSAKARTFQASVQAGAIGQQTRMAQTDMKMVEIMGVTAGVMKNANGMANPERSMNMLQEFDMQSEKYKLNQEMTDDVLDSVLGGEEIDTETDDVLNSVLDEIGLEVAAKAGDAPKIQPQAFGQAQIMQQADDELLQNRIERLGGGV